MMPREREGFVDPQIEVENPITKEGVSTDQVRVRIGGGPAPEGTGGKLLLRCIGIIDRPAIHRRVDEDGSPGKAIKRGPGAVGDRERSTGSELEDTRELPSP